MEKTSLPIRRPAVSRRPLRQPELLAPAGSFQAAAYAFQAGADGVYLGLSDFSARKGAENFTIEGLRRLKGLAVAEGRRIYVTVNTVIREEELERLAESLVWLDLLEVDGVFIQDLGVYRLLRAHFPRLPLVASTQMAVHNGAGIRQLKKLGFRRVILPRELPLAAIRRLRREHPDIEFEAFIHGALCYSYSGLCLASGLLAGRSGNRGECAQLCRSLYAEGERQGYFFSCRDLALEEEALRLAEIGIDAFKIEGRQKSPEYVYHTARYYRRLLDTRGRLSPDEERELARRRDLGFAREHTRGYLHSSSGSRLIDPLFPAHKGIVLGRVEAVQAGSFTLTVSSALSRRDGLAYFPAAAGGPAAGSRPRAGAPPAGGPGDPVIFPVRRIWRLEPGGRGEREVAFCRAGDAVRVELPEEADRRPPQEKTRSGRRRARAPAAGDRLSGARDGPALESGARAPAPRPVVGQEIWQMSSRFLDLPQIKESGYRPWRVPLAGTVILAEAAAGGTAGVSAGAAPSAVLAIEAQVLGQRLRFARPVDLQRAEQPGRFEGVLRSLFAESDDGPFVLEPVRLRNDTGLPADRLFIPPSQLKRVKNEFYRELGGLFAEALRGRARAAAADGPGGMPAASAPPDLPWAELERRERLSAGELPFVGPPAGELDPLRLAVVGGMRILPLPPLLDEEERLFGAVARLLRNHPRLTFALGLNNLGHLELVERLAGLPNARWFVDFFCYVANRHAWRFFAERVPNLLFQYFWIEGSAEDYGALRRSLEDRGGGPPAGAGAEEAAAGGSGGQYPPPLLLRVGPAFRPPLMISLGCHARHARGQRCGADCAKSFRFALRQGRNRFQALVRDCVTYLFREEPR